MNEYEKISYPFILMNFVWEDETGVIITYTRYGSKKREFYSCSLTTSALHHSIYSPPPILTPFHSNFPLFKTVFWVIFWKNVHGFRRLFHWFFLMVPWLWDPCLTKNDLTIRLVWAGTLYRCWIHHFFFHKSGRFPLTWSQSMARASRYYSWSRVSPSGTEFTHEISWVSKKQSSWTSSVFSLFQCIIGA